MRPVPVPDEQSAPFWAAAAEHRLVLARCSRCGTLAHPPDVICPSCHHTDPEFTWEEVSGRGTVCSWTVLHQSFVPGFDDLLPLVLVDARLEGTDDLRLIGRLVDGPSAPLQLGDAVNVVFEDLQPGVSIPAFALDRP
jgi:hypothetical protein